MVPFWQHGQRKRLMRASSSTRSRRKVSRSTPQSCSRSNIHYAPFLSPIFCFARSLAFTTILSPRVGCAFPWKIRVHVRTHERTAPSDSVRELPVARDSPKEHLLEHLTITRHDIDVVLLLTAS